jgi:Spy/CpxP family protein refolding chaperone
MKKRATFASMVAVAALLPILARADADKPGTGPMHGPGGPRLFLVLRMADALGLSDEKTLAVNRILKQGDEKREELRKKRMDLEKQIRDALAKPKPDSAALSALVDQAIELHKQQEQIADDSFNALKKLLTVEEQAKLVLLRSRLRREFGFHPPEASEHEGHWHHRGHGGPDHGRGPGAPDGDDPPPADRGGDGGSASDDAEG